VNLRSPGGFSRDERRQAKTGCPATGGFEAASGVTERVVGEQRGASESSAARIPAEERAAKELNDLLLLQLHSEFC